MERLGFLVVENAGGSPISKISLSLSACVRFFEQYQPGFGLFHFLTATSPGEGMHA